MSKVLILGAGSFGIALAELLLANNHEPIIWSFMEEEASELRTTRQTNKLPGVIISEAIAITTDISTAKDCDVLLFAVPSVATRNTARNVAPYMNKESIAVTVTKGLEKGTLLTQHQILTEELGKDKHIAVLSGPTHAEEVVKGLPTCIVAGCEEEAIAKKLQEIFMTDTFRVYTSNDLMGIEMGASIKNVIALAAGISDGLGFGDNAKAALITRGIKEISALSVAVGGKEETLAGLTGVGDLIVTCASIHSRNRMAGYYIGQGIPVDEAIKKVGMVVEGAVSAESALVLAKKYNVSMPITEVINKVLFEGLDARKAGALLMAREAKPENK